MEWLWYGNENQLYQLYQLYLFQKVSIRYGEVMGRL